MKALLDCPRMMRESAEALHSLVDEFQRHTKILRQLGEPVDQWSTMLEHLLCIRLDDGTLKAWEDFATTVDEPNYARLVDFLQRRIRVLESMSVNHQSHNSPMPVSHFPSNRRPFFPRVASHTVAEEQQPKCYACSQYHFLVKCPRFERMNVADRMKLIDTNRLCANCFRHDHFARNCQSKYSCRHCQRRHHTMLHNVNSFNESSFQPPAQRPSNQADHQARPSSNQNNTPFTTTTYTCANSSSQSSNTSPSSNSNVLLSTVVLLVVDSNGSTHPARALLDSGSQSNIMSERLCQLLKLRRRAVNIPVHGVGESASNVRHSVHSIIKSRKNDFAMDLDFLVLPRVTIDLPAVTFSAQNWRIPQDLFLADPSFNKSGAIDLLLGAEHFYSFVNPGTRIEQDQQHLLIESVFGWIVVGRNQISPVAEPVSCHVSVSDPLHNAIERFWKMEEINNKPNYSVEEQQCETHFVENVTRNTEGRYMVRFPRHPDFDHMLGDTKAVAMRQYLSLENRLERDPNLKQEYQNFLDEYLSLGHLRIVSANEPEPPQVSYIPHHPVVKESSTTTKVRVVFNGSVHSTTGFSLNDTLKVGPVVQDELLTLIIRFRKYPVALVADIEKIYRQVLVDPRDTPLQRIFWRFQPDGPIETCELLTVTYGLASSSFLATRTLNQLCQDEGDNFPLGGPALIKNFYVDDYIGGAQSIGEAINTRTELNELLVKGGFQLRKWASNVPRALEGLDPSQIESKAFLNLDTEKAIKTLGVRWEPKPDKLSFEIASIDPTSAPTKRTILSGVSKHFDPLGITSPVVIRAKILLQELWLQPCGWDDEIPDPVNEKWTSYCSDLAKLSSYAVDRYVFLPNSTYELHTFADASEQAYGACTFARSISSKGQIRVHLIAAKSRVAPLKRLSIPRLELSAAVLAARLHAKILEALDMAISASYFWSDSSVTLEWLRSPPHVWKTFIANRVSEIQTTTHGSQWNHVAGTYNPADLITRGMKVDEFLSSDLWQHGPFWLSLHRENWPTTTNANNHSDEVLERRVMVAAVQNRPTVNDIFLRTTSYQRLLRITAYCLRFINACRQRESSDRPEGSTVLTVEELSMSRKKLVKLAQADSFGEEIRELATQQTGQLPQRRITPSKPFTVTGVDYAGPVYLKPAHKRASAIKAYICVFVCFATKAVHIELVSSLSTAAFIAALRRFVSRRGRPTHMYSDNGKNFEGARNELRELHQLLQRERQSGEIATICATDGIKWHMIPPKAPHFGGLWEAAVKTAKKHLRKQLGNIALSFEDMSTILAQIEACMNSRPLTPMTEIPDDLAILTPSHFLIASSLFALPETDVTMIPLNRLDHYQKLQERVQKFWYLWRTDYLHELQKEAKQSTPITAYQPGRMVILVDESLPPVRWPLARITATHPGSDGLIRVVTLRTSKGIIRRPITKICLLPYDDAAPKNEDN
ncbi:uncharacterized protein LOC134203884 [Armigeres subalbatus]|uniref:uncharacterized protein LOC134203884 n=1 Tax=Armigeres subalbatus TaxID=124917 RepID=UPI002ED535D4